MEASVNGLPIMLVSLLVAFLLATIPLPDTLNLLRPEWVLLALLYWSIAWPERVGLLTAWVIGILVDLVEGALLGQHAISFVLAAFFAVSLHQQIRMFSLTQQTLLVAFTITVYELIDGLILEISGDASFSSLLFLPVFLSTLLWPVISVSLQRVRKRYRVL